LIVSDLRPAIGVHKFAGNTDEEVAASRLTYNQNFAACAKAADLAVADMPKSHDHKARSHAWTAAFNKAALDF
jgi:hypothetical protein